MISEELHPWMSFVPENSTVLIVGTFPSTVRNWSFDFFYPNKANRFWKIMAEIAGSELKYFSGEDAVNERKNILRKLKIAVTDMGKRIIRQDNSSLDEKLKLLEYMDIFRILDENPTIEKIFFTGGEAAKWFNDFLLQKNIRHKFPAGKRPIKSSFCYNNKQLELVILHSPSPRAANKSVESLVEMYKNRLESTNFHELHK